MCVTNCPHWLELMNHQSCILSDPNKEGRGHFFQYVKTILSNKRETINPPFTFGFPEYLSPVLWLPTTSLMCHLLLFGIGYAAIAYPVLAEILQPDSVRPVGMSILTAAGGLFAFANAKTFHDMNQLFGEGTTFTIYGTLNIMGGLYIWLALPEL